MDIQFHVAELGMRNSKKLFLQGLREVKEMLQSGIRATAPFSGANIVCHILPKAIYNHNIAKAGKDIQRLPPLN